ncbi:dihydrolipoyl dehydrogenase family protein [Halobacillus campisalis]|uniref:Dihydrolipoyl dehydrogenase family protein n=1 Tax=Halobacillus campisalis TaxID=435909 RepID=A0ABW2K8H0_9BACI|nr:FAD-dependent oxidoreductase [Halobacillus campisalis]
MEKYGVIVIGGGSGGLTVASGAASLGAKTALIEKEPHLGGDCLHVGCVPSKAFIEAANEVHTSRQGDRFGLEVSGKADMKQVNRRVRKSIDHIQEHDSIERFEDLGVRVLIGKAQFENPHTIVVGNHRIRGDKIVISTGSRSNVAPISGLEEAGYITNETVFDLEWLPSRLAFIGGGPIGLELAQAFSRLGTQVTVLEGGPAILSKEDGDIQQAAAEILKQELNIVTNAKVDRVSKSSETKKVHYEVNGLKETLDVDEIFVATGRKPNTEGLGLDSAGVIMNNRGFIQVDGTLRTSQSHIFAIGDVNGAFPFTHVAGQEGKLVVQNALFNLKRKISYDYTPWNTYTTPEIFHFGLTQEEAVSQGREIKVYKTSLDEVDRFIAEHKSEGFIKIITDNKGKILGAHAIGKGAGDWMQVVILAVKQGAKIGDLSQIIYPYPNHAAAIERVSNEYWRAKLFSGFIPRLTKKVIKWLP